MPKYQLTDEDKEKLDNVFTYHTPKNDQLKRYEEIRSKGKELAKLMMENCSSGRERSLALTALQQSTMWANASIAINE